MTVQSKLAIVIPYYKINFFKECLDSLANQINKNFTIYIGDDASPEDPSKLLNRYNEQLKIEYKRFKENLGGESLTGQWDRCINLCEGEEWIMILGDDDVLGENVVEQFYSGLPEFDRKTNVIRFASQIIDSAGNPTSKVYTHPEWEKAADSFFRWLNGKTRSSLSEHVFSKEAYDKHRFKDYPLAWHSDDMAWLDFSGDKKIYSINKGVIRVRHSGYNITTSKNNLELKRMASSRFQNDLIFENLKLFGKFQKRKLLLNFEIFQKDNYQMSMQNWHSLLICYLKHGSLVDIVKFFRRFLIFQMKTLIHKS